MLQGVPGLFAPHLSSFPLFDLVDQLPDQPTTLGPVHDPDKLDEPLPEFSDEQHAIAFGGSEQAGNALGIPPQPAAFCDPYLYPSLARNEFTRLSMLWYFTEGIKEDNNMLRSLSQILELVKQQLSWEFAIIGLVDARSFTRLVTVGTMELAIIPRRESPCSHTINQEPGTVFAIPDMSADWRFKGAPTAGPNGLRSYAGTQISMYGPAGEVVVLGSICTASKNVQPTLTAQQRATLIRASVMCSHELATRTQLRRMRVKQTMLEDLAQVRATKCPDAIQTQVVELLKAHYTACDSKICDVLVDNSKIDDLVPVDSATMDSSLWEDRAYIENAVLATAYDQKTGERPVRALVASIDGQRKILVVLSSEIRKIFDNLDIWFIKECAAIIKDALQAQQLQKALAAREAFLSTIRHELRTPIHGILSSLELLTDELKARNLLASSSLSNEASIDSFLRTMRLSGNELMSTINNILRMNTINTSQDSTNITQSGCDLEELERNVLGEVLENFTDDSLSGISIRYENKFPPRCRFRIDYETVKEILKALLCNGVAATRKGTIFVSVRFHELDKFLSFDIEDTGAGIPAEDQERIFLAFEKVDPHAKGAGLGLSLAKLMTNSLKGKLELIASCPGAGSHFRLEIPASRVETHAETSDPSRRLSQKKRMPLPTYCMMVQSKKCSHLISHVDAYLQSKGMCRTDRIDGSLIIANDPEPFQQYSKAIRDLKTPHTVIVVTDTLPTHAWRECIEVELQQHRILPLHGPLYTTRLDEIFGTVELPSNQSPLVPNECDVTQAQKPVTNNGHEIHTPDNEEVHTRYLSRQSSIVPEINISKLSLEPSSTTNPIRALLVDDNQINLSVLEFYCKKRKIPYGTATNGHRAVSLYRDSHKASATARSPPYSLVLMDMQMPECNGIEATRQIRELEEQNDLPRSVIFMITGQDTMADRTASLSAGSDGFFTKPLAMKRLTQIINDYFPDSAI